MKKPALILGILTIGFFAGACATDVVNEAEEEIKAAVESTEEADLAAYMESMEGSGMESELEDERRGQQLYALKVRPALDANCIVCHNAKELAGELTLENFAGMKKGGSRGTAIKPYMTEKSLVYLVASGQADYHNSIEAPRFGPDDVDSLREWIELGAPVKE